MLITINEDRNHEYPISTSLPVTLTLSIPHPSVWYRNHYSITYRVKRNLLKSGVGITNTTGGDVLGRGSPSID